MCWRPCAARQTVSGRLIAFSCGTGRSTEGPTSLRHVSANQGTVSPDVERRLHPSVFYVDPTNAEGMERLMRLAENRSIPVFWLLPPLSPALQSLRDQSGSEARYEQFIRTFMAALSATIDRARRPPRGFSFDLFHR